MGFDLPGLNSDEEMQPALQRAAGKEEFALQSRHCFPLEVGANFQRELCLAGN